MKILYAEDNQSDIDLTRRALDRQGGKYELEVAGGLSEAIQRLEAGDIDLVLTDFHLPDGDGLDLVAHIRRQQLPVAVVMITGRGAEETAVAALKAGADDYLAKRSDYLERLPGVMDAALASFQKHRSRSSRPIHVLYAEHNPADVDLTRRHLERHAPHILLDWVENGRLLLQRMEQEAEREGVDVVLLDYRLAGMNALEVLKELRYTRGLDTPLVLVTGHGDEEIAAQSLRLGAADYLTKNPGYLYKLPGVIENAFFQAQWKREQRALQESEARFRRLAENAPDLIYRYRLLPEPGFEYVSPAALEITGYTPEEHYADPQLGFKLVHPDDRHLQQNLAFAPGRRTQTLTLRWVRKDGSVRWTEQRNVPIFDEAGQVVALEGIVRDVTFRVLAEQRIQRQLDRLGGLRRIDTAIAGNMDLAETLDLVVEQAVGLLEVDAASILLLDSARKALAFAAGKGFRTDSIRLSQVELGAGVAGKAALYEQSYHITDLQGESGKFARSVLLEQEGFHSYHVTPLIAKDQVLGVLEVYQRQPFEVDQEWSDFFETLAGQAAIAIDNARLLQGLQESNRELVEAYEATLEGWARALELRDRETEGHSRRVVDLTLKLAEVMGIPEKERVHIRRGALLHDIGKLGVPDAILNKPGPLDEAEWEIMRQHPSQAYLLLAPIEHLRPALDIPYCHHERWDGAGYPRRLKGEEIPLAARIFAVVDVWEALLSDRPYRKAWSRDRAVEYLKEQSGKHFDPRVVRFFLEKIAS